MLLPDMTGHEWCTMLKNRYSPLFTGIRQVSLANGNDQLLSDWGISCYYINKAGEDSVQ